MDNNEDEVRELRERVLLLEEKDKQKNLVINDLVTRVEFTPVKMIAYGLAGAIMSSVLMAILSKVLTQ